jgi:hypothetical protein
MEATLMIGHERLSSFEVAAVLKPGGGALVGGRVVAIGFVRRSLTARAA